MLARADRNSTTHPIPTDSRPTAAVVFVAGLGGDLQGAYAGLVMRCAGDRQLVESRPGT